MTLQLSPKSIRIMVENPNSSRGSEPRVNIFVDRKLGSGKFNVFHAYLPIEETEYALKTFPLDSEDSYRREKEIISSLNHKHVIKYVPKILFKDNEDLNSYQLLLEYAPHGNFCDLTQKKAFKDDKIIRTYFHHLIAGVEYLHSKGITHGDLKLDNLLLGEDFILKITDFDQSQYTNDKKLNGRGTQCYRAPEVLEGKCEDMLSTDVYSIGIILYTLKAKEFPFAEYREGGRTKLLHYDLFMNSNEEFWSIKAADRTTSGFFSQDFKDLVNGMLESNHKKRFTINDIKRSRWYNGPVYEDEELKVKMEKVWEKILFEKSLKRGCSFTK